jgi:hypothetical protein
MTRKEFLKAVEKILGRSLTPKEKELSLKHSTSVDTAVVKIITNSNKLSARREKPS